MPILSAISAMSSALTPGAYIAGIGVRSGTSPPSGGPSMTSRSSPVSICESFQISEVGRRVSGRVERGKEPGNEGRAGKKAESREQSAGL